MDVLTQPPGAAAPCGTDGRAAYGRSGTQASHFAEMP